jgi:hypothetical protein
MKLALAAAFALEAASTVHAHISRLFTSYSSVASPDSARLAGLQVVLKLKEVCPAMKLALAAAFALEAASTVHAIAVGTIDPAKKMISRGEKEKAESSRWSTSQDCSRHIAALQAPTRHDWPPTRLGFLFFTSADLTLASFQP